MDARRFVCAALACLAIVGVAHAADPTPHWIWYSSDNSVNTIYARHEFDVPAAVKSAYLVVSADNHATVYVNGQKAAQNDEWQTPERADVVKQLKQGKNVIALQAKDDDELGAVIAVLAIETTDGKKHRVVTDPSWRVSDKQVDGWRTPEFDDKAWQTAHSHGLLGAAPWNALALDPGVVPKAQATIVDNIKTLPDFKVELLYSVPKSAQGSWVCMTPDPKGRLIVSDQSGSLYRVTPPAYPAGDKEATVEKLDLPIGQAQGLLWAFDSLYVVVNGSAAQGSGFYRCTDEDKDGELDKVTLLKKLNGGGEHGPHAVRLGPDGKSLWVIAGNHTDPPADYRADSPVKNFAEDHLLPRNPDGNGHATGRMAPGGWIARTDENGKEWTLYSAGFRNQYDIDFNTDGEVFTYDADMEWDTGAPWYRATRVNHGTSGSEFGWRFGTGKWPAYYVDSLGAVVDIGLGSPTGVEFGTGAKYPEKYQRAFYICDWTYGKLYAVHMKPQGSSYTASFETFVEGRPLPLTDVVINKDGHLYFTIGGRGTQSGLYRVAYTGSDSTAPVKAIDDPAATAARELRRKLEAFHGKTDPAAVETAWPHLNSRDRVLRFAARVAIEWQPVDSWKEKALAETKPTAAIQALCALARSGDKNEAGLQAKIVDRLNALPWSRLTEEQLLDALRAYQLTFIRMNGANPKAMTEATPPAPAEIASKAVAVLNPLFPSDSESVNRELCILLTYLEAPGTAERAMAQLQKSLTQQDQFSYAFILRNLKTGWTPDLRKAYFGWLNLAENKYRGGNSFKKFIAQIRRDAIDKLTPEEKVAFKDAIEAPAPEGPTKLETTRQFVHNWQMPDVQPILAKVESGRSFEKGKLAFEAAQCAKCHRFAGAGGDTGPDITGVGNRFSPEYILESIVDPSKAVSDQYRNVVIETVDGQVYTGRIINESNGVLTLRTDPFARELTKIRVDDVASREESPISEMPQGLINVLTQDEILDLVAYLRAAGNENDKAFKPGK